MNTKDMTASELFAAFLQKLRDTGTQLPSTNANIASMVQDALEEYNVPEQYDDDDEETQEYHDAEASKEALQSDMEIIAEALRLS